MPDILADIDAVITATSSCGQCGAALDTRAGSADFCGEGCQAAWAAARVGAPVQLDWLATLLGQLRFSRPAVPAPTHPPLTPPDWHNPAPLPAAQPALVGAWLTPELAAYYEALTASVLESARRYLDELAPAIREFAAQAERAGAQLMALGLIDEAEPTDPWQRAMWLRRNRNTGPTPRRQRAPRRLPPGSGGRVRW